MIYHFRIILDTKEDVFRDVALEENATFEDFHNAITQAFGFSGSEMAVFYESDDEWQQGDSISLFDMGEDETRRMSMGESVMPIVKSLVVPRKRTVTNLVQKRVALLKRNSFFLLPF